MMDEAIRIKAKQKKVKAEELAKQKRLKAISKQWKSLYNQTLVEFRKWGPEMLQEIKDNMDLGHRLLIGTSLSKASKTPRRRTKKAPLASPPIEYILPCIKFNDLPAPPAKARLTGLLPLIPTTSPSAPSLSKRRSLVKQLIRRRTRRAKEAIGEVIEPPETLTISGRRSKRRLFHDKVLAKSLANQKT
jgi:hypothetical protein